MTRDASVGYKQVLEGLLLVLMHSAQLHTVLVGFLTNLLSTIFDDSDHFLGHVSPLDLPGPVHENKGCMICMFPISYTISILCAVTNY